ncbi:MAG: P22 phage major capsid protein family protein [Vicinamibacterales bacterium]
MSNTLAAYDPIFYAQEALIQLEKALGLSGRVHRGYDKNPQEKGSTITISAPSTFIAQDAPSSAQAVSASSISISLDYWKEVKFALTDKELSFTGEKIITDHIRPAAYALADKIDQILAGLYVDIPWYMSWSSPAAVGDVTSLRQILFDNKVPLNVPGMVHCMVDGQIGKELLDISAFTQNQGGGQAAVNTQMTGHLGTRYGIEFFENQNTPSHTSGTMADPAGAVDLVAGYDAGTKTIHVDSITAAGTLKAGDIMTVTGHTQKYVLTADATADGGGDIDVSFEPGLESAVVNDQVVTFTVLGSAKTQCLAFHQHAFALAMAPLSELGNQLGAKIATVHDPVSNLALRSRLYYDGDNSKVVVALDCLFGVRTLNRNLAARGSN